jgi:hypothetical protein
MLRTLYNIWRINFMNKCGAKIAACAIVGTLSFSGYQARLEAKMMSSASVPSAGIAVVLDGSSTIEDLQDDVVQNIAYLENVSGVQPNIVRASELAATKGTPTIARKTNVRAVINSFDDAEIETQYTTIDEETEQETQDEQTVVETTEENSEVESEATEQESTDTSEDINLSAGFSATETYDLDDVETETESESEEVSDDEAEVETESD